VGENIPQKQSWAEKPFLERLGIVLGIFASIAAIVGGIYFLWDRYWPTVPDDAAEVTTVEVATKREPSTEKAAAEEPSSSSSATTTKTKTSKKITTTFPDAFIGVTEEENGVPIIQEGEVWIVDGEVVDEIYY